MSQTDQTQTVSQAAPLQLRKPLPFGRKTFVAWTVFSALGVWLGLSITESLAAERCYNDSLAWNWKTWSCQPHSGTIILPSGLRRAGSD